MRHYYLTLGVVMLLVGMTGCTSVPTCSNVLHSDSYKSVINQYGYAAIAQGKSKCWWHGSYNSQIEADEGALGDCAAASSDCNLYAEGPVLTDWGRQREQESQQAFQNDTLALLAVGNQLAAAKATATAQNVALLQQQAAQQQIAAAQQQQMAAQRQQQQAFAQAQRQQLATQQQSYLQMVQQQQAQLAAQQQQAAHAATQYSQTAQQGAHAGASRPSAPQYHPAFVHSENIANDSSVGATDQYGRTPLIYSAKVTNTGDVTLFCQADTKALTWNTNVNCGAGGGHCEAQSWYSNHGTDYVPPGGTKLLAGIRYFAANGSYSVKCDASP
jgi:hypothetical protein